MSGFVQTYTPTPAPSGGKPVKDMTIDYKDPDVGASQSDALWNQRHGG